MKRLTLILVFFFTAGSIVATSCSQKASGEEMADETAEASVDTESAEEEEAPAQASPRKQASGEVDGVSVAVDYGSPSVKGRAIWGGLESYGKVWRAGANEATSVEFGGNVTVNGEALPAGKYAFFIIPNEDEDWVVIFNKVWEQWGAFRYDDSQDALRVDVSPEWAEDVQESLMYDVTDSGIGFAWEKARINLEVKAQ